MCEWAKTAMNRTNGSEMQGCNDVAHSRATKCRETYRNWRKRAMGDGNALLSQREVVSIAAKNA